MGTDIDEIKLPFVKAITAWLMAILASLWQTFSEIPWDLLAQFAAFSYSCVLLGEWALKKWKKRKEKDCGTD